MPFFLAGLALLLLLIFGANRFAAADPRKLAGGVRKLGGVGALLLAALLLFRGLLVFALPLAVFGLGLLGMRLGGVGSGFSFGSAARRSPGQKSQVRTGTLTMELDHDTGRMEGLVLSGRFAGRPLSSLGESELCDLLADVRTADPQAVPLLESYLDWRFLEWRDDAKGAGAGQQGSQGRARPASSRMDKEEAYAVLGLDPGASAEAISRAHRNLMKKLHPDQGGSNYLAARINEAKEVLLGK